MGSLKLKICVMPIKLFGTSLDDALHSKLFLFTFSRCQWLEKNLAGISLWGVDNVWMCIGEDCYSWVRLDLLQPLFRLVPPKPKGSSNGSSPTQQKRPSPMSAWWVRWLSDITLVTLCRLGQVKNIFELVSQNLLSHFPKI